MARARRRKPRKGTKMRMNECRVTASGMEYCKFPEGVRFTGQVGGVVAAVGSPNPRRRGSGTKGKSCQRFKRVPMKGKTGTVRRCAQFN